MSKSELELIDEQIKNIKKRMETDKGEELERLYSELCNQRIHLLPPLPLVPHNYDRIPGRSLGDWVRENRIKK